MFSLTGADCEKRGLKTKRNKATTGKDDCRRCFSGGVCDGVTFTFVFLFLFGQSDLQSSKLVWILRRLLLPPLLTNLPLRELYDYHLMKSTFSCLLRRAILYIEKMNRGRNLNLFLLAKIYKRRAHWNAWFFRTSLSLLGI